MLTQLHSLDGTSPAYTSRIDFALQGMQLMTTIVTALRLLLPLTAVPYIKNALNCESHSESEARTGVHCAPTRAEVEASIRFRLWQVCVVYDTITILTPERK